MIPQSFSTLAQGADEKGFKSRIFHILLIILLYDEERQTKKGHHIMKLLLVEDNERLIERIKRQLGKQYVIDAVSNGAEALEKITTINYAVIMLDLGLPDTSGAEVCRQARAHGILTPILILTGADSIASRVELLNLGADDYVAKPFHIEELRARILALTRRQPLRKKKAAIRYQDLIINPEERTVIRAGTPIQLRRKEFDILEYLISNNGRVLTREMIINHAWDSQRTSWNSTVDVHIKHLRDKIDRPFKSSIIKTAYGLGYKVELPE